MFLNPQNLSSLSLFVSTSLSPSINRLRPNISGAWVLELGTRGFGHEGARRELPWRQGKLLLTSAFFLWLFVHVCLWVCHQKSRVRKMTINADVSKLLYLCIHCVHRGPIAQPFCIPFSYFLSEFKSRTNSSEKEILAICPLSTIMEIILKNY